MKSKNSVRSLIISILVFSSIFILSSNFVVYATMQQQPVSDVYNLSSKLEQFDFNQYYYQQLNSIEKALYQNLIQSQESFLKEEKVIIPMQPYDTTNKLEKDYYVKSILKVCKAYTYNHPEVEIWFHQYAKAYFHSQNYTYVVFTPKNVKDSSSKQSYTEQIKALEAVANDVVNQLTGTDVEKIRQIHDWLIQHAIYDKTLEMPQTRTAYGAMVEGRSVCSGFAYAFKYLADLAGLQALYVTGNYYNSQTNTYTPHAWNIVYADGNYFLVDVTFDNPSNYQPKSTFLLASVYDQMHVLDTNYFTYPF